MSRPTSGRLTRWMGVGQLPPLPAVLLIRLMLRSGRNTSAPALGTQASRPKDDKFSISVLDSFDSRPVSALVGAPPRCRRRRRENQSKRCSFARMVDRESANQRAPARAAGEGIWFVPCGLVNMLVGRLPRWNTRAPRAGQLEPKPSIDQSGFESSWRSSFLPFARSSHLADFRHGRASKQTRQEGASETANKRAIRHNSRSFARWLSIEKACSDLHIRMSISRTITTKHARTQLD